MATRKPPSNAGASPKDLRAQARQARRLARYVVGNPVAQRLLDLADELEAEAAALEAAEGNPIRSP
jgi:hypothetical protein